MTDSQLTPSVMAKLLFLSVASMLLAGSFGLSYVGGPRLLSEDDKNVKDVLAFAMNRYNTASNDMFTSRPIEVLNATVQLVNGFKYNMFVKVGRTTCKKPTADFTECAFHETPSLAKTEICHFVVLNCVWKSEIDLLKAKCE